MATADEYANWLVNNQDKAGTEDFETVRKAYLEVRESSGVEKAGATLKGVNVGIADIAGAPVDLLNKLPLIGNLLPGEQGFKPFSENPIGGSQSIRNTMSDLFDIGYKNVEDLPADQRPFAVGGEVVGQTAGTVLPIAAAARNVSAVNALTQTAPKSNTAAQILDTVVKTQARKPATTAGLELSIAAPAAVGAGIAEAVDPGDPTSRLYGELAGAFSPLVYTNLLPKLTTGLTTAIKSKLPGGVQAEAAKVAQQEVISGGGDPAKLAAILRASGDTSQTSAQITGDERLLAIENQLVSESSTFSDEIGKQTKQAIAEFNEAYRQAITSGDPELVRQAAEARRAKVLGILDARVKDAEKKAQQVASTTLKTTDPNAANVRAREILDEELSVARSTEKQLWSAVDRNSVVEADNFLSQYNELKGELTVGESLPEPVSALAKSLGKARTKQGLAKGETTSGDLLRARSRYLERAREARANNSFGDARRYQLLADAMLDDLDVVVGETASTARAFSRELNNKFTKGFVGKTLGFDRDGSLRVAPERTIESAVAGSDVQQRLNLQAQQAAAGDQSDALLQQQQDFFTNLAARTTNFDGSVNPDKLQTFINNNADTLRSLGLEDALTNVTTQRRLADRVAQQAQSADTFINQKSAAARLLKVNNVSEAITKALRSGNVAGEIGDYARLAKRSGNPAVLDGLRYGIYETLLDSATVPNSGLISGNRLEQLFNAKSGGKTLKQTLVDTGALTSGQANNIDRLIRKTKQFEAALANTSRAEDLLGGEDIFFDLLLRAGGANIGSLGAAAQATGTPLVLAGAGSRAARKIGDQIPKLKVRNVIAEALKDPKLMATLLEKPTGIKGRASQNKRLNAILVQAGILDGSEILEEENN
jgi:gas vesicle protein